MNTMKIASTLALMACLPLAAMAAGPANWPSFRGADGRGVSEGALPDTWSNSENVAWKADIAGRGWSSPVIWGNDVILTTVINHGQSEPPKKGLYFGGERPEPSKDEHEWKVICLALDTGAVRWEQTVHRGAPAARIHVKNSYASETPVTDGAHIYACFGGVGIFCLDIAGKEAWKFPLSPLPVRYNWGTAASPVLHEDKLFYVNDNDEASYLLALDPKTGKELWRVARDEKSNWATPFAWRHAARTEIVTAGSGAVRSYDLTGKELWTLHGMSTITIAMPYAADGLLYVTSGYVGDKMKPVYAIKPGGNGDISPPADATSSEFIAWSNTKIGPYNPSTVVYDGRLYVLYDRGMLSCYDAKTGTPHYERQKFEESAGFTVSPWAAGGKVYCLDEDGNCFVVRAGDTFELLKTNKLAEDDMCMATPAIAGERLVLRSAARVYCIQDTAAK